MKIFFSSILLFVCLNNNVWIQVFPGQRFIEQLKLHSDVYKQTTLMCFKSIGSTIPFQLRRQCLLFMILSSQVGCGISARAPCGRISLRACSGLLRRMGGPNSVLCKTTIIWFTVKKNGRWTSFARRQASDWCRYVRRYLWASNLSQHSPHYIWHIFLLNQIIVGSLRTWKAGSSPTSSGFLNPGGDKQEWNFLWNRRTRLGRHHLPNCWSRW